jgi:hypothetical protein
LEEVEREDNAEEQTNNCNTFSTKKLLQSDLLSFVDVNISHVFFARIVLRLERMYVLSSEFKYVNLALRFNVVAYKKSLCSDEIMSKIEQNENNMFGVQMICCSGNKCTEIWW